MINENNKETQQVLLPIIVDKSSIKEHGRIAGSDNFKIAKSRVCSRSVDVILVPGTKEQYDEIMRDYSHEYKSEDRDKRCAIPGENGKLIRCPECNKCCDCKYYYTRDYYGTATFSDLSVTGEDGDIIEYETESPENYDSAERYVRMLAELIQHVTEIDPSFGTMMQLLHDGKSRRQVADEMGLPKSTVIDRVAKLRKITDEFLDNLTY